MTLLDEAQIEERIGRLQGWARDGQAMEKTYHFASFRDAIEFVNLVAALAEEAEHHPDIDIRYDRVRLRLATHSAGGLTARDFALAERIDESGR